MVCNTCIKLLKILCFSYTYNSDLGSYTPATHGGYAYATTPVQTQHQQMAYDISADYVDSTTAYDPRPGPGLDTLSADSAIMANVVTTGLSHFEENYFIILVTC
jgi:nuclear receptor subfamily 1 group F protein 4